MSIKSDNPLDPPSYEQCAKDETSYPQAEGDEKRRSDTPEDPGKVSRTSDESIFDALTMTDSGIKILSVFHTKSHLNLRIHDPMQDDACLYFVENSALTPKKPDVILFAGSEKQGCPIAGVARWSSMYSKEVQIGLGDAGIENENGLNIPWEKMTCTSGWKYSEHRWKHSIDHKEREFVWKRTHHEGLEPEHNSWSYMNFKLLDAQTNKVVVTFASNVLKAWKKFGRFTFRQDLGENWQLMVVLVPYAQVVLVTALDMAKRKTSSKKGGPKPAGNRHPQTPASAGPTTSTEALRSPRMIEQPSPPDSKRREGVFRSPNPEFLSAVRIPPDNTASNEPGGLSFAGNTCYRNAVIIMLLSTQPIMSFIHNYHKWKLLSLEDENEEVVYNNGLSVPAENYSNLLLDLDQLYPVMWDAPSKKKTQRLRQEMDMLESRLQADPIFQMQFPPGQQSDARQFLEYFLNQCAFQLDESATFLQDAQDWRDLFTLRQADRKRCRGCWQINHIKHRTAHIQANTSWTLVMKKFDHVGQEIKQKSFTLDELLRQWRKTPGESWYCDDCVADFEAKFKDKYGHLDKNSAEYRDVKKERDSSNEDWRWYSYTSLPEVLFVDIIRFQSPQYTGGRGVHPPKDQRVVEIPEYVDMAPALDKDVPAEARHSTNYRLRAVILHAGSVNRMGMCSGHYVNYIRSADDQWWYVNDHKDVESMSFEDVNKPRGKAKWGHDFTPYILCYERVIEGQTPTPQGRYQSTGVSSDVTDALQPPPVKKSASGSTGAELSEEAPCQRPAKVSQGVQTVAASTATQGTQTDAPAPRSTASQGTQTAATSTRNQGTQTVPRRTTSQATQTVAPRTTSQGTQTTRLVQVDASTQTVSMTLPPASPPSPPQPQAILHLSLTLGSTTYNLTPAITDLSPSLLDEITRGAKLPAKWMATIELPPTEQLSSKDEGKAKKGERVAKAGVTKRRAGAAAVSSKRLIELDAAVSRTFFVANDVTGTMRRSARVAGRKQAAIKKQQEAEQAETKVSGKGKNKSPQDDDDNNKNGDGNRSNRHIKSELDAAARDAGERCGLTPSPGSSTGGDDAVAPLNQTGAGLPAPGTGGSADWGVSPRTRVPLSPTLSTT
ncbi:hypothetical protein DV737_g5336, partial [Chaetothyriales sp. CBS 132003]